MPRITYIAFDGTRTDVDAAVGTNVMQAAVDNQVAGIDGDCGGQCACATCHVFVAPEWQAKVGPRNEQEEGMLAFAADLRENSRLSCQITVTDELDGLVLNLPEGQH
jgi:2Fe-2S ferredoxin